jgi:serine/threonine protein kinase
LNYEERWEILENLGEGGQGRVYRVLSKRSFDPLEIRKKVSESVKNLGATVLTEENVATGFTKFQQAVDALAERRNPENFGALKVLHAPTDARDPDRAKERMKDEIAAMSSVNHTALLKIIDKSGDGEWYVSRYYAAGTLTVRQHVFKGNVRRSVEALRPVIAGVAELHKRGYVHRDVKPQNIFLDAADNLVLGDFGLVYFSDARQTRLSNTVENVGSRDWMPAWAYGIRVEDVSYAFDVFSLGKVLWSMISGLPLLQLWYFRRNPNDLESLFPGDTSMRFVNTLLARCIVENESDCLPDAGVMLEEIDTILHQLHVGADPIHPSIERACKVCGIGRYGLVVDRNVTETQNFGFSPAGARTFKIFACGHCGHVQLFAFGERLDPSAWHA